MPSRVPTLPASGPLDEVVEDLANGSIPTPPDGVRTVRVGAIGPMLVRGGWLAAETVVVPALILYLVLRMAGPVEGLLAVLGWRVSMIAGRVALRHRIPASVALSAAVFCVRTTISLAVASVTVYLWQPVIISALLGVMFIVTALAGRPMTMRLAQDVVVLPPALRDDVRVQRIFAETAYVWGGINVAFAAAAAWAMQWPTETVVLIHGCLGLGCIVVAVGGAIGWGLWRFRSLTDLRLRCGSD